MVGTKKVALGLVNSVSTVQTKWFWTQVRVHRDGVLRQVFVGGTLVGQFGPEDDGMRNLLMVKLSEQPGVHKGRLAKAFEVTSETLRLMRQVQSRRGSQALFERQCGGSRNLKITTAQRDELWALFDLGASINDARDRMGDGSILGRSTVQRVRAAWAVDRETARTTGVSVPEPQTSLPAEQSASAVATASAVPVEGADASLSVATNEPVNEAPLAETASSTMDAATGAQPERTAMEPSLSQHRQHLGAWVLLAMVASMKLYAQAEGLRAETNTVGAKALQLALDAVIIALAIGDVEGALELATNTAPVLPHAKRAPSAAWVRKVLHGFARAEMSTLHLRMVDEWIREGTVGEAIPAVFYIDDPQQLFIAFRRRGLNKDMGASYFDLYDEDSRLVACLYESDSPPGSAMFSQATRLLREALGPAQRMVVAFDRGGASPEEMASLRDEGFEFVTYERDPPKPIPESSFDQKVEMGGLSYALLDSRKKVGAGRGRVRRITVRCMSDGEQITLLAVSDLPAERLLEIMHGGVNQLDCRQTGPCAHGMIEPNAARRRLHHAFRIARAREVEARRLLAQMKSNDPRIERTNEEISKAQGSQNRFLARCPAVPTNIALRDSERAVELGQRHDPQYKLLLDTVRIACANAEGELVALIKPTRCTPKEAKRAVRNVFLAPGDVRFGSSVITVTIAPKETPSEPDAIRCLFVGLNRRRLTLPGDPARRSLRFKVELQERQHH